MRPNAPACQKNKKWNAFDKGAWLIATGKIWKYCLRCDQIFREANTHRCQHDPPSLSSNEKPPSWTRKTKKWAILELLCSVQSTCSSSLSSSSAPTYLWNTKEMEMHNIPCERMHDTQWMDAQKMLSRLVVYFITSKTLQLSYQSLWCASEAALNIELNLRLNAGGGIVLLEQKAAIKLAQNVLNEPNTNSLCFRKKKWKFIIINIKHCGSFKFHMSNRQNKNLQK